MADPNYLADKPDFIPVLTDKVSGIDDPAGAKLVGNMLLSAVRDLIQANLSNVAISGGSIAGITALALADGGTGAPTAAGARANLGLGAAAEQVYEEGTFTPIIQGSTTAGVGTYTSQIGRYTRIGNRAQVYVLLSWSAHDGTGNMLLTGMPFQALNNEPLAHYHNSLPLDAGTVLEVVMSSSNPEILLRQIPTGGGNTVPVSMDTAASLFFSGTYEIV